MNIMQAGTGLPDTAQPTSLRRLTPTFILPRPNDRTIVAGQTGSGKTVFALHLLSMTGDYRRKPWVFLDWKRDQHIHNLRGPCLKELEPSDNPPRHPGLYVIKPLVTEDDEIEAFLWRIHRRGNCGLFIDEGYMVPGGNSKSCAFSALLTQGRSKNIPMIILSQRPKMMNLFAFTEAQQFAVFFLQFAQDRQRIEEYTNIPDDAPDVGDYECRWYDQRQRASMILTNTPTPREVIEQLRNRAPRRLWG